MACILQLTEEERTPFAYIVALDAARLRRGTGEHREIGEGLAIILEGLLAAPDGPIEVELANDEMYSIGVHNHVAASELEEYWLDNRASMRQSGDRAPFPDDDLAAAISRFYPEVVADPENWQFQPLRPVYLGLGFKIDRSLTEGAPRVRGIYNKERAEIIRRTRANQTERAKQRGRLYPRGVEIDAWRRLFREGTIAPGEMTEVNVGGLRLLIANVAGEYYAITGECTHAPELNRVKGLSKGELDSERLCVTCPWHGAQFSLRSGKVLRQPYAPEFKRDHLVTGRLMSAMDFRREAAPVRAYATRVEDGFVWVNAI